MKISSVLLIRMYIYIYCVIFIALMSYMYDPVCSINNYDVIDFGTLLSII